MWWQRGRQLLFRTKSEWGPGPWQDEPDRIEWRHASGLPCLIVRNHMGSLCGYVGVPPEHPFYRQHYDSPVTENIHAHGGLTYSDLCQGLICHKPEPGEERDIWWFGFDCGHYQDVSPGLNATLAAIGSGLRFAAGETYRPIDYVRAEVDELAEQVAAAGRT